MQLDLDGHSGDHHDGGQQQLEEKQLTDWLRARGGAVKWNDSRDADSGYELCLSSGFQQWQCNIQRQRGNKAELWSVGSELWATSAASVQPVPLLPLTLLIVPLGGEALDRAHPHVQHPLQLFGLPLLVKGPGRFGVDWRKGRKHTDTKCISEQRSH